jgi:(heptosyl)LPS beta-1,4-glucosyltransferase
VPETLAELLVAISSGSFTSVLEADCYYLARRNNIWGHWIRHSGWWPDYNLRFFKNGFVSWPPELHAVPVTKGKVLQLPAKKELALEHYNYNSVSSFIQRLDRYSSIQADERSTKSPIVSTVRLLQSFRQEFIHRFAAERGFLDHQVGTGLSLLQSMSELTVLLKIWENQGGVVDSTEDLAGCQRELSLLAQDFAYWRADFEVQRHGGISRLIWRLRRKMRV